jgi:hypothetical protein
VATCGNHEVEGYKVGTWTGLLRHDLAYCGYLNLVDEKSVRAFNALIDSSDDGNGSHHPVVAAFSCVANEEDSNRPPVALRDVSNDIY